MANVGRTLFSQVMDFVPWTSVDRIITRYGGDIRIRTLPCSEQFRIMAFAQMTYRESLRDIEACLGVQPSKLYGMGLRQPISKSTLADANEVRRMRLRPRRHHQKRIEAGNLALHFPTDFVRPFVRKNRAFLRPLRR